MGREKETAADDAILDRDFKEATEILEGKSKLFDNLLDAMGDGLSIQDRHMRIIYQNKYMLEHFGSHIGEYCYKIYENRDAVCEGCPIVEALQTGKVCRALRVGTTHEGEKFRYENIASLLRNDRGEVVAGMELVRLVEDRERAIDALREAAEKLMQAKAVYENSSEGIMVVDQNGRIVSVNPAFRSITGYSAEEVIGADPGMLGSGRQSKESFAEMWRALEETGTWQGELWNRHKDGHAYAVSMNIDTIYHGDGTLKQRVCVFSDITEKKRVAQRIAHMAQHDALTNLPNRTLLTDRLEHAIALSQREKSRFALLYIDLDRFKPVNDTFGHIVGDALLQMVARRMRDCIRESDTVARMGGDEFAVLLAPVGSRRDALGVAEKLRTALEAPFAIEGKQLEISCSIGCAFYPDDGSDEDALAQNADKAMYHAKTCGRNRVCFADEVCRR